MSGINHLLQRKNNQEIINETSKIIIDDLEKYFKLNKKEQEKLLRSHNVENIPYYEKDRVLMLLKIKHQIK